MATAITANQPLDRGWRLTSAQQFWLVCQAAALVGIAFLQWLSGALEIFLSDAVGSRLLGWAIVLSAVHFAVLAGGSIALNRLATSSMQGRPVLNKLLQSLLSGGCIVAFYAPTLFILMIGPSALAIRATMSAP